MVRVEETTYKNFGKCVKISNDKVELYVTIDFGPRIIRYGFVGGENMLFEDINREISQSGELFDEIFDKGDLWYLYGGHRLWTSPEVMPTTYYPDNAPVEYRELDTGVRFIPPEQKRKQIQMIIDVTLDDETSKVEINHKIFNVGLWYIEFAAWAISVMSPGGKEVIPVPRCDTGLLPNRCVSFWPYSKMNDPRVCWGDKFVTLKQDAGIQDAVKFGFTNDCITESGPESLAKRLGA